MSRRDGYDFERLTLVERRAVLADFNRLTPQLKPAWDPVTGPGLSALVASESQVYVVRHDARIIGLTVMVPHRHLPGLRYHVEDVVIAREHRGLGVGRQLLEFAMNDVPGPRDLLRSPIAPRIKPPRTRLYSSLGFRPSQIEPVFRLDVGERDRFKDTGSRRGPTILLGSEWRHDARVARAPVVARVYVVDAEKDLPFGIVDYREFERGADHAKNGPDDPILPMRLMGRGVRQKANTIPAGSDPLPSGPESPPGDPEADPDLTDRRDDEPITFLDRDPRRNEADPRRSRAGIGLGTEDRSPGKRTEPQA